MYAFNMFMKTARFLLLVVGSSCVLWQAVFIYKATKMVYSPKMLSGSSSGKGLSKVFVYLVQTERCLPAYLTSGHTLGSPSSCKCDVIVISYLEKCTDNNFAHVQYIHKKSTWTSGRNRLLVAALEKNIFYQYFIFMDDDVIITHSRSSPPLLRMLSPFRAYERWLLKFEPAVGLVDYSWNYGYEHALETRQRQCNGSSGYKLKEVTTVTFDPLCNAFHHRVVTQVLPYPEEYDNISWYHSNWYVVLAVEIMFPGQAVIYGGLKVSNTRSRDYPRGWEHFGDALQLYTRHLREKVPVAYQRHSLFELIKSPYYEYYVFTYLEDKSKTYCMNAKANAQKIPYAHVV